MNNKLRFFIVFIFVSFQVISCKDPVLAPAKRRDIPTENKLEAQIKYNKTRDIWQRPNEVLDFLGDIEGKKIADIGAGTGFFAFRLLFRNASVLAIDIDPQMLEIIETFKMNLNKEFHSRLETRLALPKDPKIEKGEVDIILIINTVGYIEERVAYLTNIYNVLPEGGKMLIVDFKSRELPIDAPPAEYRVPLFQLEQMVKKAGFKKIKSDDTMLDYQYMVLCEK